jgi:ankyrin repeat protein
MLTGKTITANGQEAMVKLLFKSKSNVNSYDNYCNTPLSWARDNNARAFSKGHGHKAIVELLLETGKNRSRVKNDRGRISLPGDDEHIHKSAATLLFQMGQAGINFKSKGEKVLFLANAKYAFFDIIEAMFRIRINWSRFTGNGGITLEIKVQA